MSRILKGVEADRAIIRGAALKIIRQIVEQPVYRHVEARRDWLRPPPLAAFKRLEPLGFGVNDDGAWWVFNPEDCTPDVVWPLSVGAVLDHGVHGHDGEISLSLTSSVTAKQVRGYASRFGPYMVRYDEAQTDRGKMVSCAALFVWIGGRWADAQNRTLWNGRAAETAVPDKAEGLTGNDRLQPSLATAIALRQRYEWAVALGLEHSPSVRFATDPTGIKELFRIRDLPEGRDRREALLVWVSDHWRQHRHDPDVEIYVRKHLRGATAFTWRGMVAELLPSQFDIEKREHLIAEREAMRLTGQDRRLRVD